MTYLHIRFSPQASEKDIDSVAEWVLTLDPDAQVSGTHEDFLSRFLVATQALKVGTSPDLSALRKEVRAFLEGHKSEAVANGRTVVLGDRAVS